MAEIPSSVEHVSSSSVTRSASSNRKVLGLELRVSARTRGIREEALEMMRLLRRTRRKARDSSRVRKSGTVMLQLDEDDVVVAVVAFLEELEEESLSSAVESIRT